MRYTITQFLADFPNDEACLDFLFNKHNPVCPNCHSSTFYRIKDRPAYVCYCGKHFHPLKGTVFERSRVPLMSWFYAIYLFSVSRNGVAALEIQRHIGVTYKTAWRMAQQIRKMMYQDLEVMLEGVVEVDEVFIGGRRRSSAKYRQKIPVYGLIQRDGLAKAFVTDGVSKTTAHDMLRRHVYRGSQLMTDDSRIYSGAKQFYDHQYTVHSKREYVRDNTHTNTIEGFWGQLQRSFHGTHHSVSKKWMQLYVDEFIFRYNHRGTVVYHAMLDRITRLNLVPYKTHNAHYN